MNVSLGKICGLFVFLVALSFLYCPLTAKATVYVVSTKSNLQTRMNAALPGDTILVASGTYNWGSINITNNNGTSTSNWIVMKPQNDNGVVFTGSTYLQFFGRRILITGFRFANGNTGTTDVISFRNSSGTGAQYCRLTNIIIENYSSDSTGSVAGTGNDTDNKWVSLFGTNNRVDHCTFIDKYNAGATVVVWYDNNNYPQKSTTTQHRIDSNYFNGRGYLGANGGESIRVGTSTTSRTNGYNLVEYNLFENCVQVEPEIISNKSNFNTYRYNTFKNSNGGLTLRHGRFCSVYGNFFIVDDPSATRSYGIRVIDKGHKVFNNYLEGLLGNKGTLSSLRCPIILYNGISSATDTTTSSKAAGYFPADSTIVAFNTIVNCSGGAGIVLGFTDGGNNTFQPTGIVVANNLVKMTTGQAAQRPSANTALTFSAEGNIINAPSGIGISPSTGFSNQSLSFGPRATGILASPALVQDAAVNTTNYTSLLQNLDVQMQTRSAIYDVGASELNASGVILTYPLDSNLVGAGKPQVILPVRLLDFNALQINGAARLQWQVSNEYDVDAYVVEWSSNGENFRPIGRVETNAAGGNAKTYTFVHPLLQVNNYYRIQIKDKDGRITYSKISLVKNDGKTTVRIYPNPARSFVNIDISGTLGAGTIAVLLDASGRQVLRNNAAAGTLRLPVSQLSPGMYTLQLLNGSEVLSNHPFLIADK